MFLIQLPEYNSFPLNETKINHFTRNLEIKMERLQMLISFL